MANLARMTLGVIRGAALGLGSVCLAAAILAQAGRIVPAFDVLSHFAPVWFLGGLACALSGGVLATGVLRLGLVGVGAIGAGAAAMLIAPEFLRPSEPPAPATAVRRIRLIQFNAWDLNRDAAPAADWIAGEKPDVVTIEEITPALRAGMKRRGFHAVRGMTPSIAIFSRSAPGRARSVPPADWPVLPEFARANFAAPGGEGSFDIVAVHLLWPTERQAWPQLRRMAELLSLYRSDRLLLAGDFNLTPWSFTLRRFDGGGLGMERRDRALPTWPAHLFVHGRVYATPAFLPIDHVYAGPAWRTIAVRRGPSMGSDHYPLVVDLALAGGG
jgi:endonuclease/exonuclease/phosphatase (EEP) superfamily protein YafD